MSATRGRSGEGATTSGCGLKRRNAPQDHEDSEMMNQDQLSTEDWCGRFWNGMELLKDVNEKKHFLPTGLEGIDTLLGGGLRQGQLTEITGPSSSGKTQTKDARLKSVMKSIICESVFDIFALFEVLHQLEVSLLNCKVNNGGSKVCLLIIDSISSLLAPIIGGKYPQGRSMMISVAMILKKLADEHNLSVLVTNHMVSAGNGAVKPALGESWKAVPHVRLMISRECENNICTATVLKHTLLASGRTAKFVAPS
ncbi:DNA repair protein RAD51 homolog 4-like isoform X2 [Panicum virgatum]|uniref:DNA repair protein RAD51 homolog 4-like isoform X2 n=1 Tax=Panicum virgatum TaxID=38727 RepID=UPI0019D600B4|nr:DNA repair protein RAD51 homolog 4-like isoform X2 [Panicum virgatum]